MPGNAPRFRFTSLSKPIAAGMTAIRANSGAVTQPSEPTAVVTAPPIRPVGALSTSHLSLASTVARNPALWQVIDVGASRAPVRGRTRGELDAPVSPSANPSDTHFFEHATDPSLRWYLPRYRLATQLVSGKPHYRARLTELNGQWRLELTLEPFPAPELGPLPPEVNPLPHTLEAGLRWEIRGTGGATRELPFTERLDNPDGTVAVALLLASLQERDEIFTALTNQEANATLLLRRHIEVAIPVGPPEESRANGEEATPIFQPGFLTSPHIAAHRRDRFLFDSTLIDRLRPALPTPQLEITGSELFEVKGESRLRYRLRITNWQSYPDKLFASAPDLPPCGSNTNASRTWVDIFDGENNRLYGFCALGKARDLENLWVAVPLSSPPGGIYIQLLDRRKNRSARSNTVAPPHLPLYEVVQRSVEVVETLFFNPTLHGYIFQGIAAPQEAGGTRLVRHQVNWGGRWHAYYQDELWPHLFYYLPDTFKLMRRPEPPHSPLLLLELMDPETGQYRIVYAALPHYDWDRLEAAEQLLREKIPAGHSEPIAFEPLQPGSATFVPFNPSFYEGGTTTLVKLETLRCSLTLKQDDFATVWDELNGAGTIGLSGKVQVAVQGFPDEEIPVSLRLDDTIGALLDVQVEQQAEANLFQVRMTNRTESPLQINALSPFLVSTTRGFADVRPADWQEAPSLGEPLAPGSELQGTLLPREALDLQGYLPLLDTDQVRAIPDTEKIFDAILANSVRTYRRPVTVQVPGGIFSQGSRPVAAIQISFVDGDTVMLLPSEEADSIVQATGNVRYPLKEVLLGRPVSGWYRYHVVVAWQDGEVSPPSEPETGEAERFFLRVPQLSG